MNAKFFDLKQEKQDRMINAALKIFALNGYTHASTDEIVKEARISKGLLFHYFESKIGVYSFLYDYSARYMSLELSGAIDPEETSYMELRRQMEAAKMQTLKSYPYMQMFINTCDKEMCPEAVLSIEAAKASYENAIGTILSKADMDSLRSNPNFEKLIKMLDASLDSIMDEAFRTGTFNAENLYKESISYIDIVSKYFA